VVDGGPILDVMDKFRSDLEVLQALARGIDIAENENFQTLLPHGCWGTTRRNFCPGRS